MALRILLVEDSEDDALLIVRALEQAGWELDYERVDTRETMEAAIATAPFDVVLADYVLPGFGGLDALALVRERTPETPFILVSGKIGEETAVEAMHAGAHDFVAKSNLVRLPAAVTRELHDVEVRRERRQAEAAMALQAAALGAAGNAIFITDAEGRIEWVNRAFVELTGYPEEDVLDRSPDLLRGERGSPEGFSARVRAVPDGGAWKGELTLQRKNGEPFTVLETITPLVEEGGVTHVLVVQEDITARKAVEARVEHLAHHDALTDLPNRSLLRERLEICISRAESGKRLLALFYVDLDGFKNVNDLYGHATGDFVLSVLARSMLAAVRSTDTVARLGGDEFAVLLPDLARREDASALATKVLRALSQPVLLEGREVRLGASAGIAIYPGDGGNADELIQAADVALYETKARNRGGFTCFSPDMAARLAAHAEIETRLRRALARDSLSLEYQPRFDLSTGDLVAAEALVRWGSVPPADFIPVAEQSGIIFDLDTWVLRRACAQAASWASAGSTVPCVAVNVSALHARDGRLVEVVEEILNETGLAPAALELEIAERALLSGFGELRTMLTRLRERGVHVAIDDFGTGFFSLGYLSSLPVDRLKIDTWFVAGIGVDRRREEIALATIGLGHGLGLRVTAEGIETAAQLAFLTEAGCDEGQGFLLARPEGPESLEPGASPTLPRQGAAGRRAPSKGTGRRSGSPERAKP